MIKLTQVSITATELTITDGDPVWINRNMILTMRRTILPEEWKGAEFTTIQIGNSSFDVKETPEEIIQLG